MRERMVPTACHRPRVSCRPLPHEYSPHLPRTSSADPSLITWRAGCRRRLLAGTTVADWVAGTIVRSGNFDRGRRCSPVQITSAVSTGIAGGGRQPMAHPRWPSNSGVDRLPTTTSRPRTTVRWRGRPTPGRLNWSALSSSGGIDRSTRKPTGPLDPPRPSSFVPRVAGEAETPPHQISPTLRFSDQSLRLLNARRPRSTGNRRRRPTRRRVRHRDLPRYRRRGCSRRPAVAQHRFAGVRRRAPGDLARATWLALLHVAGGW